MTDEEWNKVNPTVSFSRIPYEFTGEPTDYNLIIEYPKKAISTDNLKEFLKKGLL